MKPNILFKIHLSPWENHTHYTYTKRGDLIPVRKTIAKFVLLSALVLSAFSIAGAVVNEGKDGPEPLPLCPPCDASR